MRGLRWGVVLLVLVAGLALPGVAGATDPGFVDQYQEPFPIGGGNDHAGHGHGNDHSGSGGGGTELPASTETKLENAVSEPVADALRTAATSPELGAPERMLTDGAPERMLTDERLNGSTEKSSLGDAISTSAEPGNPYLLVVLLGIAAITFAGAAAAVARRRVAARSD